MEVGDGKTIEVLLASYNGEKYIRQQLDSILDQTVPGIRILASDDGSTDGTVEILRRYEKEYPGQVTVAGTSSEDEGKGGRASGGSVPAPAANFFRLLAQADADYILLSDQDDVWLPEKTGKLLARIRGIEGEDGGIPALVFSDMEVVDKNLNRISASFFSYAHSDPRRLSLSEILPENPVTGGALMMNRALLEQVREMPEACFMHDWWIALCAVCFGRISCVREALSLYRQHGDNSLGARAAGSLKDVAERPFRQAQVEQNYRRMFDQAAAFLKRFGGQLTKTQRETLRAWLALPMQTPAERLRSIRRYHFYKSSRLQTLAMCFTIPRRGFAQGGPEDRRPAAADGTSACVILNYNDAETTEELVCGIRGYKSLDHIVIVDNASADGSFERLSRLRSRKISVIRAAKNGGYGAGNNLGVRYASEVLGAKRVLIANPDVLFTEECLRHLESVFHRNPKVGAAAAVMRTPAESRKDSAPFSGDKAVPDTDAYAPCGKGAAAPVTNAWRLQGFCGELLFMGPLSRRLFRRALYYPAGYYRGKRVVRVDVVHGSMLMVNAEAFKRCGGYDENMFLYQEEMVLARRLRAAGFCTVLLTGEQYIHRESVSVNKSVADSRKRQTLREESVLYYMEKYLGIGPVRKRIAELWFWGIRMETGIFSRLTRLCARLKPGGEIRRKESGV